MDKILIIIAFAFLVIALWVAIFFGYKQIIKNKKTYARKKAQNGDVHLDEICPKYLKLTNSYKKRSKK